MDKFLKIKDFSQLIGVSVRTLQYYDEIDLLPPAKKNAQGHRFYNDHSFSFAFMIVSLKRMGVSLEEIKQILGNKQPLGSFILEEKQRVELEIGSLQNRLIQLTHLEEYLKTGREVTPEMLVLLGEGELSKELLAKVSEKTVPSFDLEEFQIFLQELALCYEQQLPYNHPSVKKCLNYWRQMNEYSYVVEMTTFAEKYYAKYPEQTYGMKKEWYAYLKENLKQDN